MYSRRAEATNHSVGTYMRRAMNEQLSRNENKPFNVLDYRNRSSPSNYESAKMCVQKLKTAIEYP